MHKSEFEAAWNRSARTGFLGSLAITAILMVAACSTPAGKQAKRDAVTIQRNDASAQMATHQAQNANDKAQASNQATGEHLSRAQQLLARIDAKDKVINANSR